MRKLLTLRDNTKSLVLVVSAILIAITVSVIGARSWYTSASKSTSLPAARLQPSQSGQIQTELITFTPRGFEPSAITRAAGKVLLTIDNRSGLKNLTMRMANSSGQTIQEKQLPEGKLTWRELVDLQPGSYTIVETSHPDWVCHITISN